jgi:hypothetical protein
VPSANITILSDKVFVVEGKSYMYIAKVRTLELALEEQHFIVPEYEKRF